jgi:hypothetical protein
MVTAENTGLACTPAFGSASACISGFTAQAGFLEDRF